MNVKIVDGCIGCSLCTSICSDVFRMNDNGTAEVYSAPTDENKDSVKEAADSCPASVIVVE